MSYDIKKSFKAKRKAMSFNLAEKYSAESQNRAEALPFFFQKAPEAPDLCISLRQNLFKLEEKAAFFKFAVQELGEASGSKIKA